MHPTTEKHAQSQKYEQENCLIGPNAVKIS